MRDLITVGDLLVQPGPNVPRSLLLPTEINSTGWAAVNGSRSAFEKTIDEEGWTFFFMAGEIEATVVGFDKQKALRTALKRLIAEVTSQRCNSIEITGVVDKSFLRIPYVSISAHARHLQKGQLFSGSNPVLASLSSKRRLTLS